MHRDSIRNGLVDPMVLINYYASWKISQNDPNARLFIMHLEKRMNIRKRHPITPVRPYDARNPVWTRMSVLESFRQG